MQPQIPVVNSVRVLADAVRADLLAREIIPSADRVVYSNGEPGERTTPGQNQLPMVWFWLDTDFTIDVAQTGDPASIFMTAIVDNQPVYARSIAVEKMRCVVTCHARVPEEGTATPPRRGRVSALNAEEAGAQLRQRVVAAIHRALSGSFRILGAKNLSPKGSEFAYGSASAFVVEIYYHIASDAYPGDSAGADGDQFSDDEQVAEVTTDEP